MANPAVLSVDTKLYCPAEPQGRVFPAGSEWPGDAWTSNRGGKPVGKDATAQAMKDLIAAQDRIDSMANQLDTMTHSLAQRSAERDEAVNKVQGLEQRAIAAEAAQEAAEQAARSYMQERDAARSDAKRFSDLVDALRPEADKIPGLMQQLDAAAQANADLTGKLAEREAEIERMKTQVANAAASDAVAKPKKPAKTADADAGVAAEPVPAT